MHVAKKSNTANPAATVAKTSLGRRSDLVDELRGAVRGASASGRTKLRPVRGRKKARPA